MTKKNAGIGLDEINKVVFEKILPSIQANMFGVSPMMSYLRFGRFNEAEDRLRVARHYGYKGYPPWTRDSR